MLTLTLEGIEHPQGPLSIFFFCNSISNVLVSVSTLLLNHGISSKFSGEEADSLATGAAEAECSHRLRQGTA
ncbi:hypothetical protein AHAS_Ahas13G0284900 [Arachis hypogaea]